MNKSRFGKSIISDTVTDNLNDTYTVKLVCSLSDTYFLTCELHGIGENENKRIPITTITLNDKLDMSEKMMLFGLLKLASKTMNIHETSKFIRKTYGTKGY